MPGRSGLSRQPLIVLKPHLLAERAELVVGAVEAVMISQFGTVFSWDPDFRDPNECLHDEIPIAGCCHSVAGAHDKCERKPDDESNRGHRLEIALYSLELQARKVPRSPAIILNSSPK